MALQFNKLKNPRLGLTDKLTFGKLAGCRICDVAQDHYEYLIWAEKQGFVKFQPEVVELIQEQASFARWEIHQAEEVKPWFEEHNPPPIILDDDVPF
jgi:uncharacterized protein (DUF3820 family)